MYIYHDKLLVQSPYFSSKQEIRYKLPQEKYESLSEISPRNVKGNVVTYGPFSNVPAFTQSEETRIHFPSNVQFRTLER